jgi:hypothetical protein
MALFYKKTSNVCRKLVNIAESWSLAPKIVLYFFEGPFQC